MGINYCFTTALDGNMSTAVNNEEEKVLKNREKASKKYGFDAKTLTYMYQVHQNKVLNVTEDTPLFNDGYDAQVTNLKNRALMVLAADCIPILINDPINGVIAAVHAGRNSTFLNIATETIKVMQNEYHCKAENIEVIMGPSIAQCCYEVSQELVEVVKTSFGEQFVKGRYIDLQGINKMLFNQCGVTKVKIQDLCTKCSTKDYFSYRLDKNCGRFAGIIWLE